MARPAAPPLRPGDGRRPGRLPPPGQVDAHASRQGRPGGGTLMCLELRRADELRRRGRQHAGYTAFLARRLDRRRLMVRAWSIAASQALRFGDPARTWIGPALAQSWQERRLWLA